MKTTNRIFIKTSLATSLAVVATGSAGVMAAASYNFVGSDTLTEVVRDAISNASADGTLAPDTFDYVNTGSGAAEKALSASPPTQRIAPMSRNFKASVLSAHPGWTPGLKNIIGLDAAVLVQKAAASGGYSKCPDLSIPLETNTTGMVNPPYAGVDSLMGLILGGTGGVGDTAACSSPERLAAITTLASCFGGISTISHFYRRDDRSGTADTMKEKYRVQRFCSGRAPGLVNGLDNNMANDDVDPVRRPCVKASGSYAQTPCTIYPTGVACSDPTTPGCTQGLLVALSQNDPGMPDITTSIARRVRLDTQNQTVGFAGREAARQSGNATPTVNTISPNDTNVRSSAFLTARRLFVNWGDTALADAGNEAAQEALYDWMTNKVTGGRVNVDPILVSHGFLPCTPDSSDPSGPSNLCSKKLPPPAAETTPGQCIPSGKPGDGGTSICCSTGLASPASSVNCPAPVCQAVNTACVPTGSAVTDNCCAGLTCTDQGDGNFACN
jgi:hypothetical protein